VCPLQVREGCNKVFPEPSLLWAEQPPLFHPFLLGEVLQPFDHFCGPPLDPLQQVHVFPVLGAPKLETGLQVVSHEEEDEGEGWPVGPRSQPVLGWNKTLGERICGSVLPVPSAEIISLHA